MRSRAQGAGVVGVRAEGIGVRAWGGGVSRGGRVRWGGRQDYLPCKGLPRRSTPKAGSADFPGKKMAFAGQNIFFLRNSWFLGLETNFYLEKDGFGQENQFFLMEEQ